MRVGGSGRRAATHVADPRDTLSPLCMAKSRLRASRTIVCSAFSLSVYCIWLTPANRLACLRDAPRPQSCSSLEYPFYHIPQCVSCLCRSPQAPHLSITHICAILGTAHRQATRHSPEFSPAECHVSCLYCNPIKGIAAC
jgi:hypothetical protein